MSVYVDPMTEHGGSRRFKWPRSCHLYADTPEELEAMAAAIALKPGWRQQDGALTHYELVGTKRAAAVARGAMEHTREQRMQFVRSRTGVQEATLFFGGK